MIQTRLQPRFKYWTIGYTILCLAFGIWGGYDYWVAIPRQEQQFAQYLVAAGIRDTLELEAGKRLLNDGELQAYEAAKQVIASYAEPPEPVAGWDKPLQLWAYVIGCGVIGFPWCAWMLYSTGRKSWSLNDDGSLTTPEGLIYANMVSDIDMSRWMAKSLATVKVADGRDIALDDYKYKNVDRIVAALAERFHPGQWTKDARPVKGADDEDDDEGDGDTLIAAESDGEAARS